MQPEQSGCVGANVARALSKYDVKVCCVDRADDVSHGGATKANSGIVHAGFDDKPGSKRAQFCWAGNQMYPQLDRELNFGSVFATAPKGGSLPPALRAPPSTRLVRS